MCPPVSGPTRVFAPWGGALLPRVWVGLPQPLGSCQGNPCPAPPHEAASEPGSDGRRGGPRLSGGMGMRAAVGSEVAEVVDTARTAGRRAGAGCRLQAGGSPGHPTVCSPEPGPTRTISSTTGLFLCLSLLCFRDFFSPVLTATNGVPEVSVLTPAAAKAFLNPSSETTFLFIICTSAAKSVFISCCPFLLFLFYLLFSLLSKNVKKFPDLFDFPK